MFQQHPRVLQNPVTACPTFNPSTIQSTTFTYLLSSTQQKLAITPSDALSPPTNPSISAQPQASWQCFLGGVDGWVTYNDRLSQEFDRAFLSGSTASVQFALQPYIYELSVRSMVQINLSTGKKRPVRRVVEISTDIVDKEKKGNVLVFPFADPKKGRLPIYWTPEKKELQYHNSLENSRKEGFQRDTYFWSDNVLACSFDGRWVGYPD